MLAVFGIDHASEKAARRVARAGAELGDDAGNARGLQAGKFQGQRLASGADIKKPLAAIVGAFLLHDIAFVDQLLEHAAKRLLGNLQNLQQLRNFHAGIAVDEMQDTVMGAAEAELRQHFVRIADKIAVGEKQQLNKIEIKCVRRRSGVERRSGRAGASYDADIGH